MTTSSNNPESAKSHLPSAEAMAKRRRRRYFSDGAARWMVRAGGGGVVVALALIFVYLFSEVLPLLKGASIESSTTLSTPDAGASDAVFLGLERYGEIGMRYAADGTLRYFRLADGELLREISLSLPDGVEVTSVGNGEPRSRLLVFGLSDGTAVILARL